MSLKTWLKRKGVQYWHDLYYAVSTERGVELALHCKEVVEKIDLAHEPRTLAESLRLALHLSLCQACHDYHEWSLLLRKGLKSWLAMEKVLALGDFQQRLMRDFARPFESGRK